LFWIYYINPLSYGEQFCSLLPSFLAHRVKGFGGLMDNEFMRIDVGFYLDRNGVRSDCRGPAFMRRYFRRT
jgi:hypothetical protein